jgi:hypothetical protein
MYSEEELSEEQNVLHEQAERQYLRDQSELSIRRTQRQLDRAYRDDSMYTYRQDSGILIAERNQPNTGSRRIDESARISMVKHQGLGLQIDDSTPNLYAAQSLQVNPATAVWLRYNLLYPPPRTRTADIGRANSLGR